MGKEKERKGGKRNGEGIVRKGREGKREGRGKVEEEKEGIKFMR